MINSLKMRIWTSQERGYAPNETQRKETPQMKLTIEGCPKQTNEKWMP